ncbi:zinc ribbon domain-containing protein [Sorangium sp. So ce269]
MSAEHPARSAAPVAADEAVIRGSDSPLERQIVHYARFGVPLAALVGAGVAGLVAGPPAAILVLAGGALVAVIAIFWASLRVLLGETPLSGADAYALGAPRAEEEQKQSVLRALKDLEFERSVGKISDEDYAELVAKYRAEAKRLLRLLDADAQPRREQVAALVARHLRRAGLQDDGGAHEAPEQGEEGAASEPEDAAAEARPVKRKRARARRLEKQERDAAPADGERDDAAAAEDREAARTSTCAVCGTLNDEDAVFCKKCGTKCALDAPLAEQAAADEAAAGGDENESRRAP